VVWSPSFRMVIGPESAIRLAATQEQSAVWRVRPLV